MLPPQAVELEEAVLGALMLEGDSITTVQEFLTADAFYLDTHKTIFRAMEELCAENKPIDLLTVTEKLKKHKKLKEVGGAPFLAQLTQKVASAMNIEFHATIIAQKYVQRELIRASTEIQRRSYDESTDVTDLIDYAEGEIFKVSEGHIKRDIQSAGFVFDKAMKAIEEAHAQGGTMNGVPTGFTHLDQLTLGWQPSDLIIIAARPSMGKTAFALNVALNAALKADAKVLIFSLEMAKEQLSQRLLSMEARVESQKMSTGDVDMSDWDKMSAALDSFNKMSIYIDDTPGIKLMEIKNKCRRMKAETGLDMIILDYLQLMEGEKRSDNRQQEITSLSRGMKLLAREMECPVIVLSQLSRAPDQRENHRPVLSDLRESGAIEQDADVVLFLYRDEVYNEETEKPGICEVIVAKHRNGPIGTVEVGWQGKYTRFVNLQR